ncbi:MAG: Rpp14/Pop5 family protein [Candidatus Woesearchaeota archaeon]
MNLVKPTMRERKRYICFTIDGLYDQSVIENAVFDRILRWIGEKNFGLARLKVEFVAKTKTHTKVIISSNHIQAQDVRFGIALVDTIEKKPVKVLVVYVSGILKKAKKYLEEN